MGLGESKDDQTGKKEMSAHRVHELVERVLGLGGPRPRSGIKNLIVIQIPFVTPFDFGDAHLDGIQVVPNYIHLRNTRNQLPGPSN